MASSAFVQRGDDLGPAVREGREKGHEDGGGNGYQESESDGGPVDAHLGEPGDALRNVSKQHGDGDARENEREGPGGEGEHQSFREELRENLKAARLRPSARTRNTLATFTQAMRSTKPTAPKRSRNEPRTFPTISSSRGETRGMNWDRARTGAADSSGNSATRFEVMVRSSFKADSIVAPSFNRAIDR
jgi:hypothetical protein